MTNLDALRRRVPPGVVLTDTDRIEPYRRDMTDLVVAGMPISVLRPASTAEVSAILTWANETRTPVVARGAGTGLSGGAAALDGCVVVCLERMRAIRAIDPANQTVVVEAATPPPTRADRPASNTASPATVCSAWKSFSPMAGSCTPAVRPSKTSRAWI